jgi:hypothetical protein
MRGEHLSGSGLNAGGVSVIFFQGIKVNQVTAAAIHQEAKNLFKNLRHRLSLGAFSHGAKQTFQNRGNGYIAKIFTKKLSPALEVKVSEVTSTPSITLLLSFLSAIVVFVITSHLLGLG